MRKPTLSPLIILTLLFAVFTTGFLAGRMTSRTAITVNVPVSMLTEPTQVPESRPAADSVKVAFPIDINRADKDALMELPGIGEVLAERIIVYRNTHGSFTAVEELLQVKGLGKNKLEEIWDLITIGG